LAQSRQKIQRGEWTVDLTFRMVQFFVSWEKELVFFDPQFWFVGYLSGPGLRMSKLIRQAGIIYTFGSFPVRQNTHAAVVNLLPVATRLTPLPNPNVLLDSSVWIISLQEFCAALEP
jgi:hypothetical protein